MRTSPAVGLTSILASLAVAAPAQACIDLAPFKIEDIRYADAIVVGRISKYRIVEDRKARDDREKTLERSDLLPQFRRALKAQTSWISDYATFDIDVDKTILGKVPDRITVTWDNSTFSEPETFPAGPYLIALRRPRSRLPPLHGGSATILQNQQPQLFTVLQAPCASEFILDNSPENIADVRKLLKGEAVVDRNFARQVGEDTRQNAQKLAASRAQAKMRKATLAGLLMIGLGLFLAAWMRGRRKPT